ncbi:MAG: bifunctional 4-hydroxy-2-oxoglutarate aldolase/2-dehydro-3-deoxy-phosphogluconate aldolase [Pseudomonadota bacterium]
MSPPDEPAIAAIMRAAPVIPVLVIDDATQAVSLAETLVSAGLPVIEVTLRTSNALMALREMARVPGAIVGAGTVTDARQLKTSLDAGAQFIVSPGLTDPLGHAARTANIPFLPGIATAGDIMRGLDLGLSHFKFFPAEASGGAAALRALAGPFHQCRFCPTGGISADNAADWLALDPVLCVGGSWIAPKIMRGQKVDLAALAARANAAAALRL